MQIRCQRCGYKFTLSRQALTTAQEELERTRARHYDFTCPKCRRQIKVPATDIRRSQPR